MVRNQTIRNLLELPIELIELIMSYISYDEIAKIRSVCRSFDSCSQRLLNRGFIKVEKYHAICFKKVKSQLPRRESERRSHPLARHCDVLSAIETRLSLLGLY
jgi:F-box protein 28